MKKSNKEKIDIGIKVEDIVSDLEKVMNLISTIDNKDISTLSKNLDQMSDESNNIKKEIEDKYSPIIEKLKKNLDS
tara:strand:- start:46 stop:273 length:228 start_codon:yes stop_codon:yes gene_type:complete